MTNRLLRLASVAVAVAFACPAAADDSRSPLENVQKEFKAVIEKGAPATVSVIARDSRMGCSGVLVSSKGFVLSDYDAGFVWKVRNEAPQRTDRVKVRVPDMKTGAFVEYDGRIVKELKEVDSTLIQILKPPAGGFKHLVPASAEGLHVGSFTFVSGNAFGESTESLPAVTAGVLSAATYLPRGDAPGATQFDSLYTSAAVVPGVAGGPLLDAEGRLVGVVSGRESVSPQNPYQFLGKAIPIDRLRAAYAPFAEAKEAFAEKPPATDAKRAPETRAIETVIAKAASDAYQSVASLVVAREKPPNSLTVGSKGPIELSRYVGPSSAVAVSTDGWLVTSLYNLTNVGEVQYGIGQFPPDARISAGLKTITKITAHFPDGAAGEARVVATHEGFGIAVLKADVVGRVPIEPAAATACEPGRFLVPVANPFGEAPALAPLMNFGVVSKRHPDRADGPWRGDIQTDAGSTDGNCGAAVVDLEGKLVGVMTQWDPMSHGRNSGIGFVVPWDRVQLVLLSMEEGRSYRLPRIGIEFARDGSGGDGLAKVGAVVDGGPASKAGMKAEDLLVQLGDVPVKSIADFIKAIAGHFSGERVTITVSRGGVAIALDVELGTRD